MCTQHLCGDIASIPFESTFGAVYKVVEPVAAPCLAPILVSLIALFSLHTPNDNRNHGNELITQQRQPDTEEYAVRN